MNRKVSRKSIIAIVMDLMWLCLLMGLSAFNPSEYKVVFAIMTIVHIGLLITWIKSHGNVFNYFSIILLLSYIYYFGQYLLVFFDIENKRQFTILNTYTPTTINRAAIYLEVNMVVLHAFTVLFKKTVKNLTDDSSEYKGRKVNINVFRYVSLALLIVSFACEFFLLIFKIKLNVTQGYGVALNTNYSGAGAFSHIVNFGSTLFLPALFASFVSTKGKRKSTVFVWTIYIVFIALYFMSGSRFEAVVSLAGVCLYYNCYCKKIDLKKLVLIALVGVAVLYVCSLLSNVRRITNYGKTNSASQILNEAIHDTNEDNIFTDVISTAGMQILTVTAVYDNCPSEIPYSYGEYYLFGILRIIPNVTGGTNIFITDSIDTMFRKFLTVTYGMGSSFIIEAYYNFGYAGVLMMVLYGALIAYLVNFMENRQKQEENLVLTYFVYYIAATSFFWIRSDARFLVREIVFYYWGIKILTMCVQGTFFRNIERKQ